MKSWLLRGLVFALVMVVVRLILGPMLNTWETQAMPIGIFLVLIYAVVPLAWGFVDGRADANAEPEPDRRSDLAMTWLVAGLVAGVLSALACWLISIFYEGLYFAGMLYELTTFTAFTALLTFVPAIIGVTVGRWLVDRRAAKEPSRGSPSNVETPTDVFAAVGSERTESEAPEGRSHAGRHRTEDERAQEPRTEPQRSEG